MGIRNLLFEHRDVENIQDIAVYEKHGGYRGLKKAVKMERSAVIEEIKTSGLRGRGGAGFPTGIKWSGIPQNDDKPHYIICNADEGEPGTYKDRELMLKLPHLLVEGMIIAGYALRGTAGYIYIRGEYVEPAWQVRKAIDQAYRAGYLGKNILGVKGFNFDLYIHMGAGSYECGEESALMSSLMGERGQPRLKFPHAPYPTVEGVWKSPTLINNVETFCAAAKILDMGGAEYARLGTERSKGTKIFSVSGHVARPANYEVEMGTPLMELIEAAGGVVGGALKAVIPGGSSVQIVRAEDCPRVNLDYESCQQNGTLLGSGGFMVFNDRTDIVLLMKRTAEFYMHESCGKCTPCREGTRWIYKILDRITSGGGQPGDVELLLDICSQIDGRSYCGLGDAAAWPIVGAIKAFREEFDYWIAHKRSPVGPGHVPPTPEVVNPLLTLVPA
ncbi:MAG: NADH-quinone oxidoreductase subunit NuoF [Chloroherpetonaceae bacterium]|nr:NADH-quinone oxidoreductase subunit NuoF [Chthonomonadaceae bacterium]MDW8207842.1 NADH-quinone oxidoreductase subunit NuoF [Chloroherpetonaceae bacterium]